MLGYKPYRTLIEDKFNQSDIYEMLHNDRENMAGMQQFFPHLYRDAKWSNPQSLNDSLNGGMTYYLQMRIKITQAITKWLTKNGYTMLFFVCEKKIWHNDRWWNRCGAILSRQTNHP